MSKVDNKQVTHREACEKIADMQVDSMTVEELKQWVYEDLVELCLIVVIHLNGTQKNGSGQHELLSL